MLHNIILYVSIRPSHILLPEVDTVEALRTAPCDYLRLKYTRDHVSLTAILLMATGLSIAAKDIDFWSQEDWGVHGI